MMVFKKCVHCGSYLSGQQRKFCISDCKWEHHNIKSNNRRLERMKEDVRWDRIKLNSSERAVIQIQQLINK